MSNGDPAPDPGPQGSKDDNNPDTVGVNTAEPSEFKSQMDSDRTGSEISAAARI